MRAFIAIPCPEEIRNGIVEVQEELMGMGKLKLVEPENIHLTLKFLGKTDDKKLADLKERLKFLKIGKFEISLKGLGVFQSIFRARVIWIGVKKGSDKVSTLHSIIDEESHASGFGKENDFHPHFTIARVKSIDKDKLSEIMDKVKGMEFGRFDVESIKIMDSKLTRTGPTYSVVSNFNI